MISSLNSTTTLVESPTGEQLYLCLHTRAEGYAWAAIMCNIQRTGHGCSMAYKSVRVILGLIQGMVYCWHEQQHWQEHDHGMWRKPWLKWQLAHECKISPLQTWLLHCQRQQESNVHSLTGVPECRSPSLINNPLQNMSCCSRTGYPRTSCVWMLAALTTFVQMSRSLGLQGAVSGTPVKNKLLLRRWSVSWSGTGKQK